MNGIIKEILFGPDFAHSPVGFFITFTSCILGAIFIDIIVSWKRVKKTGWSKYWSEHNDIYIGGVIVLMVLFSLPITIMGILVNVHKHYPYTYFAIPLFVILWLFMLARITIRKFKHESKKNDEHESPS